MFHKSTELLGNCLYAFLLSVCHIFSMKFKSGDCGDYQITRIFYDHRFLILHVVERQLILISNTGLSIFCFIATLFLIVSFRTLYSRLILIHFLLHLYMETTLAILWYGNFDFLSIIKSYLMYRKHN